MDKTKIKKIVGNVLNVLVWIFVVISLTITVFVFAAQKSEDGVPSLFGTSLITIETGSMKPIYNPGDLVFMKKLTNEEKADLDVGDIITFRTSIDINGDGKAGDLNTHAIYSHEEGTLTYVTKGENNPQPDNMGDNPYTVHRDDIIGVCKPDGKLAGVGGVINFLRSSLGFFLCIVLPLILFFLYELYNFIVLLLAERSKKVAAGVAQNEEEIKKRAIEEYLNQKMDEEEIKRRAIEEYIAKQKAAEDAAKTKSEDNNSDEQ
jgi:signal peptidase